MWSDASASGKDGHDVSGQDWTDDSGNPGGGWARSIGLEIDWQDGPAGPDRERVNGTFVEDVLLACARRLEFYQGGKFACDDNARSLEHVMAARKILLDRRSDRKDRGVLGKNEK